MRVRRPEGLGARGRGLLARLELEGAEAFQRDGLLQLVAVEYPLADDVCLTSPSAYQHYRPEVARSVGSAHPEDDGPVDVQLAVGLSEGASLLCPLGAP
ncbi:MAG: hypothetical protein DRJ56_07900 [Thermoprotei archaeon]|nr:MAG: hypothetical protein DRJ56_07900 [Thermoprotei archaeon]